MSVICSMGMYAKMLDRVSLLKVQFLNQLMLKLREIYLMPGESLIRAGDMSRELAFVARVSYCAASAHYIALFVPTDSNSMLHCCMMCVQSFLSDCETMQSSLCQSTHANQDVLTYSAYLYTQQHNLIFQRAVQDWR